MIGQSLDDGTALDRFCRMLKAQGVKADLADRLCARNTDLYSVLPAAKHQTGVPALSTGEYNKHLILV